MAYIIQGSPLSKLFMREYTDRCEEDPEFVFSQAPFNVIIPRSGGAITLTHNVPVLIANLLPKYANRVRDENSPNELDGFVEWLTGGDSGDRSNETDVYGVVKLAIDAGAVSSTLFDIAQLSEKGSEADEKKAKKEYEAFRKQMGEKTRQALEDARKLADQRVRRAMKNTHVNLMKSYETLRTEGKGVYNPSVAEAIGAYVLKEEIDKSSKKKKDMINRLHQTMTGTTIVG